MLVAQMQIALTLRIKDIVAYAKKGSKETLICQMAAKVN
jgi:hypothetical protein